MLRSIRIFAAAAGILLGTTLHAQEQSTPSEKTLPPFTFDLTQAQPSAKDAAPGAQSTQQQPASTQQSTQQSQQSNQSADSQSQAPSSGAESSAGFSPNMMGDQFGVFALRTILVPTQITTFQKVQIVGDGTALVPISTKAGVVATPVRFPVAGEGAFKICENESPGPTDRVFFTYNFYSDVTGAPSGLGVPRTDTVTNPNGTITSTPVPAVTIKLDAHREIFGFEKTFLDGNASIGMRAPLVQQVGDFASADFGDLTIITKLALLRDPQSGDCVSVGLVTTAPTGPKIQTIDGDVHSTLFQPWTGFILSDDAGFYVQGFASIVIPTDSRDVILLFNDIGAGYQVTRSGTENIVTSIGPAFEAHLTDPVNHRSPTAPIQVPDELVLTQGLHVGFANKSTLAIGIGEPVTGPRPFDIEAFAQFNWRF